jgi:hydroxylysine kinase
VVDAQSELGGRRGCIVILPEVLANRPTPASSDEVASLAAQFGVQGQLSALSSERDQNIRIDVPEGPSYVLKITNPAEPALVTAFETEVLEHLAAGAAHLPVPRIVRTLEGSPALRWPAAGGERTVRLFTHLPGKSLAGATVGRGLRRSIGSTLAALDAALRTISPREHARELLWDFGQTAALRGLLGGVGDAALRQRLELALDRMEAGRMPQRRGLRPQWLHNDFNPYNLLLSAVDATRVGGIVDFGDMAYGPLVGDLAVACAYVMQEPAPLETLAEVVEGFNGHTALGDAELELLPVLLDVRCAMTVLITQWRAALNPANSAYILRNRSAALAGLAVLDRNSPSKISSFLRERCRSQRAPKGVAS